MSFTEKNIFELLPAIYRIRDGELGDPLKALIETIASEAKIAEKNIADLYENWFIETCNEWVVPYIGDLLGVRNLNPIPGSSAVSQRAYVANTLSYRRRKGIAPVLEQLALDVAGWRGHVTEFFELLGATQYMNHIRLKRDVAPDLRRMNRLDLLNSAFDTIAHSVDVRHIASGRGRYNIPNIGLYIWRLQSYPVTLSDAMNVNCPPNPPKPPAHFYTFDPTGRDIHLFNKPQTETGITHISTEINVPGKLRRRGLFDELEARRQAIVDGTTPVYNFFDDRLAIEGDPGSKKHPVFEIFPNDDTEPVPPEKILIFNLSNCCTAPAKRKYKKKMNDGTYTDVDMPITVVVDPECGRFAFTDPGSVSKARVSYSYGFSGDLGSGTYNRQASIPGIFKTKVTWQVGVSQTIGAIGSEKIHTSISDAINEWNSRDPGEVGLIVIMDNRSYIENFPEIIIKENSRLMIVAADWPIREDPSASPAEKRVNGDIAAVGFRPHLKGQVKIKGVLDFGKKTGGELTINGLMIEGKTSVLKGNLKALSIAHCTLIPANGGLEVPFDGTAPLSNQWLGINLTKTICGPVNLSTVPLGSLAVADCIIDNAAGYGIRADAVHINLARSTIFGKTLSRSIEAENCIFTGIVKAIRRQTGCIRFSFVPFKNSETPRRFRCQPELEIVTQIAEAEKSGPISATAKNSITNNIIGRLVPIVTSGVYGHHAYAQLSFTCPVQINSGADNGSEMGAFYFLAQPQRSANLRIALDEYLRLGLEAGVIYVT